MRLSFVISTQPTKFQAIAFDPNFEANAAHLAQLGYDGIELGVREPDKLDVADLKRTLAKYRLAVPAIGTGQAFVEEQLSFTDPDAAVRARAIARVQTHIALASVIARSALSGAAFSAAESKGRDEAIPNLQVGDCFAASRLAMTPLVIIGLIRGKTFAQITREQAHAWMIDALKSLARDAQTRGVRLAIEPINRYETDWVNDVASALTLIEEIGADNASASSDALNGRRGNVGILFDTFHANIEEPNIEASLRACGARLFHVHVADSNRWYPGAGHTNFARIVATLREMKYAGWVSAEILPKPDVKRAAEETYKTIKPLL
ncbi:MAG: sugar phosphate isomerase/epimerase [Chloroflexi bacterium]|nr:sugar phosphate isomerase/epimerase [Chloroflexota bacterium]